MRNVSSRVALLVSLVLIATLGFSQVVKQQQTYLDQLKFKAENLGVKTQPVYLDQVMPQLANKTSWQTFTLSNGGAEVYLDRNTGMPLLVNGSGSPWVTGDPFHPSQFNIMKTKAIQYMRINEGIFQNLPMDYLQLNQERSGPLGEDGYLWFVDFDFVYQGVPIDGARVVFRCNHGNMVQFGVEGLIPFTGLIDRILDPNPTLTAEQALAAAYGYAGGFDATTDTVINAGTLKFLPRLIDENGDQVAAKFQYPLVWEVAFHREGIVGTWTAWIDAHTGQVLSFWDANAYGVVKGGILPVKPSDTEVSRGLPFANVASGTYANWAGRYDSPTSGAVTSTLAGKYVKIADSCHAISLAGTAPADLDFGTSSATDCSYGPAGYSTRAGRSCFYHVGNAKYKALQWLPSNTWLAGQLTANMNLNQTCNAYWNGSSINFFRSGGGCGNTGEIAAIFLHEFAHGMDSNDSGPTSDNGTGETYGDTVGMLSTHNSCGGPGFLGSNCDGYGDACTSCTGVREFDYAKHSSGSPHTIQNMSGTFSCPSSSSYRGPCGKEGHCESIPLTEAMWDLANRDLPSYNSLDVASSWFILDRLFYLSRSTSGSGYTCSTAAASGCGSSYWFQTFLTVDDDNGNLADGTPHSAAIYAAFNRHGVACSTYNKANAGCSAGPSTAPTLSATAANNSANLSWGAVTNASKYYVLRNDLGATNGFTKIAETTSTSYTDADVANGMTYYYRVVAVGSTAACVSPLSGSQTVTPVAGATYSISGTVSGAIAAGVTMTLSGAASATTTTASGGTYTFSGLSNGSYTVTPSKAGYAFSPVSTAVTIASANQTGKNFTAATVPTYSISGSISGAVTTGVTLTLSGAASATTTGGAYTFSGLAAGSYTITPSLSGYTFTPASSTQTISSANITGVNFTAAVAPCGATTATYNATYKAPACTASSTSCDTGTSLIHCAGATSPAESNQPNTINGACADATTGGTCSSDESVEQLAITGDGSCLAVGDSVTVTAKFYCYNATSDYVAVYYASSVPGSGEPAWTSLGTSQCGGTGVVTKTYTTTLGGSAGMQAVRAEIVYNAAITSACQTGSYNDRDDLVFNVATGTAPTTYSISGTVSGAIASGVTMTLSGAASATTTTATGGTYTFSGLANGTYTVTPSLSGYTFSPASTSVTIAGANQTGKNFTSTSSATYSISGTVSGAIASGVTMTLSGAASATTTTATGGTYTFSGLANGTYTVTPSLSGYTFSPASTSVTIAGANQTGKNFTSTSSGGSSTIFSEAFSGVTAPALPTGWTTVVTTGNAWKTSTSGCSGSALMYPYHSTAAANSWAFTPGFALTSGVTYTLTFNQKVQSASYPENLVVTAGTAASAAGQTITILSLTSLTNTTCTARTATFTPSSSGTYYLGWHCTSVADMYNLFVDDILLTSGGTAPTLYSISGTVSGAVASGVTVTLTGAASATATTATNGTYTFSNLANGAYTVTPSLSGYTFSPASTSVTIASANQTGKNFTSTASGGSTTLFTNGFESAWSQTDTSGTTGTWSTLASGTYPTCSKHGGSYMAKFNSYNATSGNATRYYQPSSFAIGSGFTTVTLTFWMYHDTGYASNADKIQPQVSTNGTTWTAVGSAINRYDGSTGWKQHTVSLTTYKGTTIYLGFLATSAYGNNMYLDDVLVTAQ